MPWLLLNESLLCVAFLQPKCGNLASFSHTPALAAQYFLHCFLEMNAERARTIPCEPARNSARASSLLALAVYGTRHRDAALECYSKLLEALRGYNHTPVFYPLDEHNEIWSSH